MKKYILTLILVLLFASCAGEKSIINGSAGEKPEISKEDKEEVGLAPNFKLRDLSKFEYTLSDYRDKHPVVLFFWTTWCPFCRRELTTLNNRYSELAREGIEVFAVDIGEYIEKVDKFAKNFSLAFKILLDENAYVASSYNILGVPTYVLIDKKGRIVSTGNNFPEAKYKELISE